jgi:hypothetical protein
VLEMPAMLEELVDGFLHVTMMKIDSLAMTW